MPVKDFKDQLGQVITINSPPKRIISLVPSQTELLFDLGLDEEILGITKFCVCPPSWYHRKTKVGGTKNFDFKTIELLSPDLILGNKEENYQEGIQLLQSKCPVWISDIKDLADALEMINFIGTLVERNEEATLLINQILLKFKNLNQHRGQKTLYLIWRKPWMAAGRETFINSMVESIGLNNCVSVSRYPELTNEQIKKMNPAIVMLSSEPFPFTEKHKDEIQFLLPKAKVILVDGQFFSWYGSRLALAPDYFNSLSF